MNIARRIYKQLFKACHERSLTNEYKMVGQSFHEHVFFHMFNFASFICPCGRSLLCNLSHKCPPI